MDGIIKETRLEMAARERSRRKKISAFVIPLIPRKKIAYTQFIEAVCKQNYVSVEAIKSKGKVTHFVEVRFIITYFLVNYYKMTLKAAGQTLGGRDHSTMLHALKMVDAYCETDKEFKAKFDKANLLIEILKVK